MRATLESRLLEMNREIQQIGSPNGSDVFQEVALACLSHRDVDWATPASRWLILRIAKNKAIDFGRRAKLRRFHRLDDVNEPRQQRLDSFDEIVEKLAPNEQSLVRGRFQYGKSFEELASELTCPTGTLRTRWHRLRLRLLSEFEK